MIHRCLRLQAAALFVGTAAGVRTDGGSLARGRRRQLEPNHYLTAQLFESGVAEIVLPLANDPRRLELSPLRRVGGPGHSTRSLADRGRHTRPAGT